MSCEHLSDAGAWVLHALDERDAVAFEAHLRHCSECGAEVARLQTVADVLPLATEQVDPPPALRDRIMTVVESEAELLRAAGPEADRVPAAPRRRERRGWLLGLRPLPAAALASVLVAVGIAGGVLVAGDGGGNDGSAPRLATRTIPAKVAMQGASAIVRVAGGHARLEVAGMHNPPAGRVYQVWLKSGDDFPRPTDALFVVNKRGHGHVEVPGSLKGVDQILVTSEPSGGSEKPTTSPVITAAV